MPPMQVMQKTKLISSGYAYPLYEQGWNLFAPAPTTNYKISYRYLVKGQDEWTPWEYPIVPYHEKHDKLAFSVSGKHVLAEYNVSYWIHSKLYKDYGEQFTSRLKTFEDKKKFRSTFAFKSYRKYVKFYARDIPEGSELQGRLEILDVSTKIIHEVQMPIIYE